MSGSGYFYALVTFILSYPTASYMRSCRHFQSTVHCWLVLVINMHDG